MFSKFKAFLGLYRFDSYFITTGSYFATVMITKSPLLDFDTVLIGLILAPVFVNFIYSINSYFDAEIDAINKPHRPIPSGRLSKQEALRYVVLLGVLSVSLPPFLASEREVQLALYVFPLLGVLYSNSAYPLKKVAPVASSITAFVLVMPSVIALLQLNKFPQFHTFLLMMFLYCLALVPLKDIEDEKGDVTYKSGNWAKIVGARNVVLGSMSFLVVFSVIGFMYREESGVAYISIAMLVSVLVEGYFLSANQPLPRLYKTLIAVNAVGLLTGLLILVCIQ